MSKVFNRIKSGSTLLEFAVTAPILLTFILGAYDINRYLHVKHALRNAADTTIRCIYPSDPACLDLTTAVPPTRLYDWYKTDFDPTYNVPLYNYSGKASWNELPIQRYNPTAQALSTVTYNSQLLNFEGTTPTNQRLGIIPRWQRTKGFPDINPDSFPEGVTTCETGFVFKRGNWVKCTPKNPCMCSSRDPSFEYPSAEVLPANITKTTSSYTDVPIGKVDFHIDSPRQKANDNKMVGYNDCVTNNAGTKKCNKSWPSEFSMPTPGTEIDNYTYAVFWIRGDSPKPSGSMKILVKLKEEYAPNHWRVLQNGDDNIGDLQGQDVSGQGSHNFWPRGSHPEGTNMHQFHGGFSPLGGKSIFHGPLKIVFGRHYRFKFTIRKLGGNGSVTFRVKDIHVWYPQYTLNLNLKEPCPNLLPVDVPATKYNCPHNPPYYDYDVNPSVTGSQTDAKCALDYDDAQGKFTPSYTVNPTPTGSCNSYEQKTVPCPPPGVNGNFGFSYTPQQIAGICPPPNQSSTFVKKDPQTVSFPPYDWVNDCVQPYPPVQGTPMEPYIDLSWGGYQVVGGQPIPGDPYDPNAPSCANLITQNIDENTPGLPQPTYFKGDQPDLGCPWEELLEQEAHQIAGLPSYFVFEPYRQASNMINVNDISGFDSCMSYFPGPPENVSSEALGTYPEGVVPPECQSGDASCYTIFAGFAPGGEGQDPGVNINQAVEDFGFKALQAAVPKARLNCAGPNCAQFTVDETANQANVSVSYELPMMLLASNSITVKSTVVETLEKSFVK